MPQTAEHSLATDGVSILIPVYNEAEGLKSFLSELNLYIDSAPFPVEVVIIDDGSTDETPSLLQEFPFVIIRHETNRGYGAALKSGLNNSRHDILVMIDADGTYPPREITPLVQELAFCDMAVGARTGPDAQIPWTRRPVKWLIRGFASWIVRQPIPDLNSGLRAIRRDQMKAIERLLPDGFSLTTTITVALHSMNRKVSYLPIEYRARTGRSKFHPITDTWNMILLILRTVVLLRPLNVFLPLSFILAFLGIVVLVYSKFFLGKFMDATFIVFMMASVQMFVLGLIADLIVRINLWTH